MAFFVSEMDQLEINIETVSNEGAVESEDNEDFSESFDSNDSKRNCPRAALSFMEVKEIVAASYGENGKRCYKVSWRETWLYDDQLYDCDTLIRKFWSQQPATTSNTSSGKPALKRRITPQKPFIKPKVAKTEIYNNSGSNVVENSSSSQIQSEAIYTNIEDEKKSKISQAFRQKELMECHVCAETFDMVASIKRHYAEFHPETKPFACKMCNKRFDRKENLCRHERIHTNDRKYLCQFCGKGYTDPSGLKKHIVAKHSQGTFSCDICGHAAFNSKEDLNQHLASHLEHIKDTLQQVSNSKEITCKSSKNYLTSQGNEIIVLTKVDSNDKENNENVGDLKNETDLSNNVTQIIYEAVQAPNMTKQIDQSQENNGELSHENDVQNTLLNIPNEEHFVAIPVNINEAIATTQAVIITSQPDHVAAAFSNSIPQEQLHSVAMTPSSGPNVVLDDINFINKPPNQ